MTDAILRDVSRTGLGRWGWFAAAGFAAALHAGAAAGVATSFASDDEQASLGAPAIEVGLELGSPPVETSDLPPGQVADDSAASTAVQEQRAEVEKTDLPNAVPTETEDPDRIVSPDAREKPKEEETTKATVNTTASSESIASEAAAPQAIENAPETERSTAPAQGIGAVAQRVKAGWQKEVSAHVNRFKRYPPRTAAKNAEIVVSFTLDRLGRVLAASILRSSGDAAFDAAALAMMKRADPVPQPPARVADEGLTFFLPVQFRTKAGG